MELVISNLSEWQQGYMELIRRSSWWPNVNHHEHGFDPKHTSSQYPPEWPINNNHDNEGSDYNSKSTEEIVRRNKTKQPKDLLNDSDDSSKDESDDEPQDNITATIEAKPTPSINANNINEDESDNKPLWYIARYINQDSSDDASISKESIIGHKSGREGQKKASRSGLKEACHSK